MKTSIILCGLFLFFSSFCVGQRYLNAIFSETENTSNVAYGSAMNYLGEMETLELDFYEPKGDTEQSRPLIIFAHGGGFVNQDQDKSLVHIVAFCDSMARKGYAVASINYRLDSTICHRAIVNAMHDMKAAIRYFKKESETYRIDSSLVFVGGESAGAITSLSAGYINQESELDFDAALPLSDDTTLEGSSGNAGHSSDVTGVMCYCGGARTIFNELLFDTLAMQSSADPPLLQIHGTFDLLIPTSSALEVASRAYNVDIPFLFYPLHQATHCPWFFPLQDSWEYLDTLIDFTVPFLYAFILETSLDEPLEDEKPKVHIFPNPSSKEINLSFEKKLEEDVLIEIFSMGGHSVYREKFNQGVDQINFMHNLSSGMYYLQLSSKEFKQVIKLQVSN